jgi:hypothetical protein
MHEATFIPVIALAAPTRVSPTSATEQKQHQNDNQYGSHVVTSTSERKLDWLCDGRLASSLRIMIEVAKTDVWSHWTTLRRVARPSVCIETITRVPHPTFLWLGGDFDLSSHRKGSKCSTAVPHPFAVGCPTHSCFSNEWARSPAPHPLVLAPHLSSRAQRSGVEGSAVP